MADVDANFDHPAVDSNTIQINGGGGVDEEEDHGNKQQLKEEIKRLSEQVEKLEKDLAAEEARVKEMVVEKNQEAKALAAISAKAVELETELFRLQHDYFSVTSERDDLIGKLEEAERANLAKIGILEQEKASLTKQIRELEESMRDKDLEVRKLEKEKEKEEREERLKADKDLEIEKARVGWRKVKSQLEKKVAELEKQLEMIKEEEGNKKEEEENLNFPWPKAAVAAAASTGTTVLIAAAIFYLKYAKQQGKGRD